MKELIMFCRACGSQIDMETERIDRAFCSKACKQLLYRRRARLRKIKKNHENRSQRVTDEVMNNG